MYMGLCYGCMELSNNLKPEYCPACHVRVASKICPSCLKMEPRDDFTCPHCKTRMSDLKIVKQQTIFSFIRKAENEKSKSSNTRV